MTLNDIPPNTTFTLTARLDRLFKAAGCEPKCHCCWVPLKLGDKLKLATVGEKDEMLCTKCTPEKLIAKRESWDKLMAEQKEAERGNRIRHRVMHGGGYTRPTLSEK